MCSECASSYDVIQSPPPQGTVWCPTLTVYKDVSNLEAEAAIRSSQVGTQVWQLMSLVTISSTAVSYPQSSNCSALLSSISLPLETRPLLALQEILNCTTTSSTSAKVVD